MSRQSFSELLQKYLRGECTPEEKQFIEHWYGLLDNERELSVNASNKDELEERLWGEIQSKISEIVPAGEPHKKIFRWNNLGWISVAASLLMVGGWFFIKDLSAEIQTTQVSNIQDSDWVEQENTSSGTITVSLEDGSTVSLSSHSLIRFPKHFSNEKREIYLEGNAFFEVKKQPTRPFYVYANDVITKVLGTSFHVRTDEKTKLVKVDVVTGRVAVYRKPTEKENASTGVILTPNHAATYFDEQKHFVTSLVEHPIVIPQKTIEKKEINFKFDDTPLTEVLQRLEDAYGIDFTVENEKQYNCLLTANLTNQPLYTQLELICAALHTKYEVQGTTILLSGKGCN